MGQDFLDIQYSGARLHLRMIMMMIDCSYQSNAWVVMVVDPLQVEKGIFWHRLSFRDNQVSLRSAAGLLLVAKFIPSNH